MIDCRRLVVVLLFGSLLFGAEDLSKIPVRRVVLYKNGIGYFEHVGRVQGSQEVAISFTSGQLDDVLKSLTVLDLNGGRIAGVTYNSTAPVERQLADLRLAVGEKTTLSEFLGALRGARIEIRSGTSAFTGRLLSIERKTRISGGTTLEVDYAALLTDTGEVRTTELSPAFSVRLIDRGLAGKVDRFLDLISSNREPDLRRMVISAAGTGERSLFVSYVSEVPVWKTTYRIVIPSKKDQTPLLQGWAIVDNTSGEDWQNVQLSLVAGAPQSFVQKLSQPYYSRRPVVAMPESLAAVPQTHESTLFSGLARITGTVADPTGASIPGANVKAFDASGRLVAETTAGPSGAYELDNVPEGQVRLEIGLPGFNTAVVQTATVAGRRLQQDARLEVGTANETVTVTASATSLETSSAAISSSTGSAGSGKMLGDSPRQYSKLAKSGTGGGFGGGTSGGAFRLPTEPAAAARDLGDLFEYKLKEPITIRKNQSALVPIVQGSITAEKVSLWNGPGGAPRPRRALWITNSSELTLDGGSFSVLEEETFAGEGIFDPIRPGEKRLVSYATDLAVTPGVRTESEPQRVTFCRVSHGVMKHTSEVREKRIYSFRNEDAAEREIIVEHPARAGYKLRSDPQPAEISSGWMRFRVKVAPKQTASLTVEEAKPVEIAYELSNVTPEQVTLFVKQKAINPAIEDALRKVLAQKAVIDKLTTKSGGQDDALQKIYDDQQRVRENMKVLKGSSEERALLQRYTQQLNGQETRLAELRKESERIEAEREDAQAGLDRMIEALSFDVQL